MQGKVQGLVSMVRGFFQKQWTLSEANKTFGGDK